jgi:hypothetical protein
MKTQELIQEISVKDVDIDRFVELAIKDAQIRDDILAQMMTNRDIMVYYHCYYVVAEASQKRPDLFYPYWPDIASLLNHRNSYHRNFALTIIANLSQVDQEDRFFGIYGDYFEHIDDEKLTTGQCCVQNSIKIIRNKPELVDQIVGLLLDLDHSCTYPEKQKELLKSDVLEVLDAAYEQASDRAAVDEFIRACASSTSPKTRRTAKALAGVHGL